MKKILFSLFASIILVSCISTKDTFKLSDEEFAKFSTEKFEVLYEGKPVASYKLVEYEYYNGKFSEEYSLVQYHKYPNEMSTNILKYMHMRFPDAKIEVKFPEE